MGFFETVTTFPTIVFFIGYCLFLLLMIISLVTGFLGDLHLPFDLGVDLDADLNSEGATSIKGMDVLFPNRLSKAPLIISLTIVFFIALVIMACMQRFLLLLPNVLFWPIAIGAMVLVFWLALHITALVFKPFEKFFDQEQAFAVINYEGMVGIVKTTKVTETSGEVVVTEGARENYLDVYSLAENTELNYGDSVLIVSYDQVKKRYLVIKA